MKKEEVLEASKRENKKKDIYELEVERKGANYAGITMVLLAFVYFSYEIFSGKGTNPALYSIIAVYNTVLYGYKAVKIEKGRKLSIFTSVTWGLLTIMLILGYFKVI
ncbi:MAG: DUF6442 family protein [Lachnospiraceae bacterium]|nr:DUF6442 family protein [Lachnospiraceae bacterium]